MQYKPFKRADPLFSSRPRYSIIDGDMCSRLGKLKLIFKMVCLYLDTKCCHLPTPKGHEEKVGNRC